MADKSETKGKDQKEENQGSGSDKSQQFENFGLLPLYSCWSDSRHDTRTQVGANFESYYNGTKYFIGLIFPNPAQGLVPLYTGWSDSRHDTRTQVGANFESYYNGAKNLIGYIIAPPSDKTIPAGSVPLYTCWSDSRHDTRTQVGANFESYYNGAKNLIGYIRPPGRIILTNIKYENVPNTEPEKIEKVVFSEVIGGDIPMGTTLTRQIQEVSTKNWHWDNKFEVGLAIKSELEVGVPGIVSGKFGYEVQLSNAFTIGESTTNTKIYTETETYTATSSVGSYVRVQLIVTSSKLTVKYTATFQVLDEKSNKIAEWDSTGTFVSEDFREAKWISMPITN